MKQATVVAQKESLHQALLAVRDALHTPGFTRKANKVRSDAFKAMNSALRFAAAKGKK